jgi:hypothetical protein
MFSEYSSFGFDQLKEDGKMPGCLGSPAFRCEEGNFRKKVPHD